MSDAYRASRGGELLESEQYPRVGIVGEPGRMLEVATHRAGGVDHMVLTILGAEAVAATSVSPEEMREHISHCTMALAKVLRR